MLTEESGLFEGVRSVGDDDAIGRRIRRAQNLISKLCHLQGDVGSLRTAHRSLAFR